MNPPLSERGQLLSVSNVTNAEVMKTEIASLVQIPVQELSEGFGAIAVVDSSEIQPTWLPVEGGLHISISPTDDDSFEVLLEAHRLEVEKAKALIGDVFAGTTVRHASQDRWLMILEDASSAGKWRLQNFDQDGISGHQTFATQAEAVEEAALRGYTLRDDGALDRLFSTARFQRGLKLGELMGEVNSGRIDQSMFNYLVEAYDAEQQLLVLGARDRAQVFHDRSSNTTVFIGDRIPRGREAGVFLQEVVRRKGREALEPGVWGSLVEGLKGWAGHDAGSAERAIYEVARGRVQQSVVQGLLAAGGERYDASLFGYAVEEAVDRGIQPSARAAEGSAEVWMQAVVAGIQRIGDRIIGNDLETLKGQDIVDLAYALGHIDVLDRKISARLLEAFNDLQNIPAAIAIEPNIPAETIFRLDSKLQFVAARGVVCIQCALSQVTQWVA